MEHAAGLQFWKVAHRGVRSVCHVQVRLCLCQPEATRPLVRSIAAIGRHLSACRRFAGLGVLICGSIQVAAYAGHVLVASRRTEPRFGNLSSEEVADIW